MDNQPEFTEEVILKGGISKGITLRKTFCDANHIDEGDIITGRIIQIIKKKK